MCRVAWLCPDQGLMPLNHHHCVVELCVRYSKFIALSVMLVQHSTTAMCHQVYVVQNELYMHASM